MSEIADVDVYFKRLYSKTNIPPPISVEEFLDIMTRCKDSQIQREKVNASSYACPTSTLLVVCIRMCSAMESEISSKSIDSTLNIPNENYI